VSRRIVEPPTAVDVVLASDDLETGPFRVIDTAVRERPFCLWWTAALECGHAVWIRDPDVLGVFCRRCRLEGTANSPDKRRHKRPFVRRVDEGAA
jgi:hypothetical protein